MILEHTCNYCYDGEVNGNPMAIEG